MKKRKNKAAQLFQPGMYVRVHRSANRDGGHKHRGRAKIVAVRGDTILVKPFNGHLTVEEVHISKVSNWKAMTEVSKLFCKAGDK